MPLIAPEKKTSNEPLTVSISTEALAELRAYAKFLNDSSVAYVVTQLIAGLGRDKEFQQWKASKHLHTLPELSNGTAKAGA